ncbi:MAG: sugar ABC transporter substrate-binding protein [Frankiaceae bacterium]|nr:sugar ABC transporter substrate-binding protein [Frankiaceae bacterium]
MSGISRRDVLRLGGLGVAGLVSVDLLAGCGGGSKPGAQTSASSLTPFRADTTAGRSTGLADRVAWASTADSEFFLALGRGMHEAAGDRGVQYVTATSGNDPGRHARQMSDFITSGVGSMAMQPLNADADTPVLQQGISKGVCVQGIITAPSIMQVAASQRQIGFDQGKAAADYAVKHLGGEAKVIYFNLDTVSPALRERHAGVLAGLATGGAGIEVVGDLTVADISTTSGFNTMMSALQAHRDIKIVLGGDTIVVGAYRALKSSGKLRDDMFLSGVDGDRQALDLVRQEGPYRLSIAFAWRLMGYGLGQYGADWIAGKQVPRVVVAKGIPLASRAAVDTFEAANADPAAAFAKRSVFEKYLPLLGNVSYNDRGTYWTEAVAPPKSVL